MFIWKKEVKSIKDWLVTFKDDTQEFFTEKQLSYIQTEGETSESGLQNLAANEIVKDMLNVLEEHNVKFWDLQFVVQKLLLSYNSTLDETIAMIFTWKNDYDNIRVNDIKKVREQFVKKI